MAQGLLINRAKAATSTTGTGAVTPGSAVSPYRSWSGSGAVSGQSYSYLLEDGAAWEVGVGVYNGTTVTRPGPGVDPYFDSSTGSLISLGGTATIACVANKTNIAFPWYWNPPLASAFTLGHSSNESSNFTLTDDPYVGLIVDNPAYSGTGDRMRYAAQSAPAGTSWTATMHAAAASIDTQTNYSAVGMLIRESSTGKNILFYCVKKDGAGTYTGADCWTSSGSAFSSNVATVLMSPVPAPWVQFQRVGSTLNYNVSYDGRRFFQLTSTALTAFFTTAPDQIGLALGSNNTTSATGIRQSLTVDAWSAG